MAAKGPTILSGAERKEILEAVKWGDQVIPDTPYEVTEPILDEFNCQYYIHGDDPVMVDGHNICDVLKGVNRFKEIRRTTGVSTTDLTGKLLNLLDPQMIEERKQANGISQTEPPKQTFLQTSNRISNFSNRREPGPDDTIVYFQGSCDLMHPGVI